MKALFRFLAFTSLALALLTIPGHTEPASPEALHLENVEQRLQAVEEQLNDPEGTVKTSQADIKKLQKVTFSGYLQGRYQHTEGASTLTGPIDDFFLRRARLKVTARPGADTTFVLSFDGAKGFELKDAFITWIPGGVAERAFGFTLGQQNWCFGREVPVSSSVRECPERALFSRKLFEGERDLGLKVTSPAGRRYLLELGVFNGTGINKRDNNQAKDLCGRIGCVLTSSLDVGVSGYLGTTYLPGPKQSYTKNRFGADLLWIVADGLVLKAEGVYADELGQNPWGYLVQLAKNLGPRTVVVVRFDEYAHDGLSKADRTRTLNAGVVQYLSPNLKVKAFFERPKDRVGDTRDNKVLAEAVVSF